MSIGMAEIFLAPFILTNCVNNSVFSVYKAKNTAAQSVVYNAFALTCLFLLLFSFFS